MQNSLNQESLSYSFYSPQLSLENPLCYNRRTVTVAKINALPLILTKRRYNNIPYAECFCTSLCISAIESLGHVFFFIISSAVLGMQSPYPHILLIVQADLILLLTDFSATRNAVKFCIIAVVSKKYLILL